MSCGRQLLRLAGSGAALLGRRAKSSAPLSSITTKSGSYLPHPHRISLGITKVAVVLGGSMYVGSHVAKTGAAFLEENDIFVPEDDDDD